jgi:hypothetical protein
MKAVLGRHHQPGTNRSSMVESIRERTDVGHHPGVKLRALAVSAGESPAVRDQVDIPLLASPP